jgi:hypothetical protein
MPRKYHHYDESDFKPLDLIEVFDLSEEKITALGDLATHILGIPTDQVTKDHVRTLLGMVSYMNLYELGNRINQAAILSILNGVDITPDQLDY